MSNISSGAEPCKRQPQIYTEDHAARLKAHAGESYRPSNGTEGDVFQCAFCEHCEIDAAWQNWSGKGEEPDGCGILSRTMVFDQDDPDYPKEWIYGANGQPTCTAFVEVGTIEPARPKPYRCKATIDMFGGA